MVQLTVVGALGLVLRCMAASHSNCWIVAILHGQHRKFNVNVIATARRLCVFGHCHCMRNRSSGHATVGVVEQDGGALHEEGALYARIPHNGALLLLQPR